MTSAVWLKSIPSMGTRDMKNSYYLPIRINMIGENYNIQELIKKLNSDHAGKRY
jgi:hypothetical protein